MKKNPLGIVPKREKSGAATFKKYLYQYHWALCRIIDAHKNNIDYVVFMEEHEDVTLANSSDLEKTKFEFNQVKNVSKPITINELIKSKKTNSILQKMISGIDKKGFNGKIDSLNLISSGGFRFELHKKGLSYDVIKYEHLSDKEIAKINDHVESMKTDTPLINLVAYITPSLPAHDFENAVKGRICDLLNELTGGSFYNSTTVYNCIINDLYKKGTDLFDYENWEYAIKKKGITHTQVQSIIDQNIKRKPDDILLSEVHKILDDEYNYKSIKRKYIINSFERYYTSQLSERNITSKEISMELSTLIKTYIKNCKTAPELEIHVKNNSSETLMNYFKSDDDFTGAFLYEFARS